MTLFVKEILFVECDKRIYNIQKQERGKTAVYLNVLFLAYAWIS
jgi:hypothetical protein